MIKTDTVLEQIKDRIDIKELAEQLGLEIRNKQARCYNSSQHKHNDEHYSLGFYDNNTKYKCFTCGVSGSVVDLYMGVTGVDLKEAIKELATMNGIDNVLPTKRLTKATVEPVKDKKILETLADYCKGVDEEARKYLTGEKRGLTDETIKRFRLFSIKDYKKTEEYLKSKHSVEELKAIGILNDKGNFTLYQHKLVVPFYEDGKIVFIQARRLDDGHPKYINASLPVVLFNVDMLKTLKRGETVDICEGVYDAMILEQNGLKAVAILGVESFKPEWVELFKGLRVVLCLDNDDAGKKATKELADTFYSKGINVKTVELPEEYKDVTDYFLERKRI